MRELGADIWEPWVPEVGQRVRVRIGPECRDHVEHSEDRYMTHANGQTGTVVEPGERRAWIMRAVAARYPGHRYLVQVDDPPPDGRDKYIMAAAELELIE
jgi:hypothetical protein